MVEIQKDQRTEDDKQAQMRRLSYIALMEMSKDEKKEVADHLTLHDAITAIKEKLASENIFLDRLKPLNKYKKTAIDEPVDLRRYSPLEKVMDDLQKDLQYFPLIRRCFLESQPELYQEILQLDPTVSDQKKNELSKKYFIMQRETQFEEQMKKIKKAMESFEQSERYKAVQRFNDLLKGKIIPTLKENKISDLGYMSAERIEVENPARHSVSMETLASNEYATNQVVSSKRRTKESTKVIARHELDESQELVISCEKFQTVPEESTRPNNRESREERTRKLMKKFLYEAGVSYETNRRNGNQRNKEDTIDYQRLAIEKHKSIMVPPKVLPPARVRRKLSEGSYPNWTVDENNLVHILRYTWKGKLKKLKKFLSDENRHKYINKEDAQGRTPLHFAASWGCIRTLQTLIQIPSIKVNARDEHGKTALYKAVEVNSIDCVEALLALGANVMIPCHDTRDPITYTLTAHGDERFDMFQFLYQKGDISSECNETGKVTLLHKAIALCEPGVVVLKCLDFMLRFGGQDVDAKEADGRTPVHLAAMFGRDDLLRILLAYEPNIFHLDNRRKTAFDYESNNKSEIQRLLNRYMKHGPT